MSLLENIKRPLCRHCGRSGVNRPRGLCWGCYYAPGVRELYPSTSKFARRSSIGKGFGGLALDATPTTHAPGTPEKLGVIEDRAKREVALFHPADARYAGDPRPLIWLAENPISEATDAIDLTETTATILG